MKKYFLQIISVFAIALIACSNQQITEEAYVGNSNATEPNEIFAAADMSLEDFQKLLQTDKYVLVDFYATWCGPCKQMEPDLKEIAETMKDKVIVVRIDVDKNPTISQHFEIESLPTIQIYKNQKLAWEDIGYKTKKQLMNQLK